jgi:hypothetical protein
VLTNTFVQNNEHIGWDLSFEAWESGMSVFLNSSNYMFVRNTGTTDFTSVIDTTYTSPWKYDYPTGETHRTAIGSWHNADKSSKNEVYIVDRGSDEVGFPLGFFKLQILESTIEYYKIRVGSLDNTVDEIVTLLKNSDKRWIQFSFDELSKKELEPDIENWHLLFTQYTDYDLTDQGDTIPYLVRGALINQTNTEAVLVDNVPFNEINIDLVDQLDFSNHLNAIGYDWKFFSLDNGIYTVIEGMNYVIKHKSGTYFKLRFIGFYGENGDKGYPTFEIISL